MDAKSVRNMYSIIAVINKHTAKLHHVGSLYILNYDARKLKHKMLNTFITIPTRSMGPVHQIFHNLLTFIIYDGLWDKPETLYHQNDFYLSLFPSFYVQVFLLDSLLSNAFNPCSPSHGERSISLGINTFTAIVDLSRFNNSCLKSPASTLVDLTFQSRALRSFSLNQLHNLSL